MITPVTVTGSYKNAGGVASVGTVSFQLTAPISDGAGDSVSTMPISVVLDHNGDFSTTLYSTEDSTTTPTNQGYVTRFWIDGQPWTETYAVPVTSTIDISELEPPA
jgi:hypothetical protein